MQAVAAKGLYRNISKLCKRGVMTSSATLSSNMPTIRRFRPLAHEVTTTAAAQDPQQAANVLAFEPIMILKAVVFDVDGTMCLPQNYMFGEMRRALDIHKSVDILGHIESLPAGEKESAMEKIKDIEREAMSKQAPQPGLKELMEYLDSRGIPKAICTRNFNGPVEHLLNNFLPDTKFLPIITRDFKPPKPDPAGILHIAKELGIEKEALTGEARDGAGDVLPVIMVGDSVDDMVAGNRAGAATVLLVNPENEHLAEHDCTDLVVSRLDELIGVFEQGFISRHVSATQ